MEKISRDNFCAKELSYLVHGLKQNTNSDDYSKVLKQILEITQQSTATKNSQICAIEKLAKMKMKQMLYNDAFDMLLEIAREEKSLNELLLNHLLQLLEIPFIVSSAKTFASDICSIFPDEKLKIQKKIDAYYGILMGINDRPFKIRTIEFLNLTKGSDNNIIDIELNSILDLESLNNKFRCILKLLLLRVNYDLISCGMVIELIELGKEHGVENIQLINSGESIVKRKLDSAFGLKDYIKIEELLVEWFSIKIQ